MFINIIKSTLISSLIVFALTSRAHAQGAKSTFPKPREIAGKSEMKPHIGVRLGPTDPAGGYNNAFGYGVEAGYQMYIPFSLGLDLYRFQSDHDQRADLGLDRTQLLAKGTYNFGGDIPVIRNTYVGANLGPVLDTVKGASYLRLGMGLMAGVDFFVTNAQTENDAFSIGANANYVWVTDTDADALGINGVVKYWF